MACTTKSLYKSIEACPGKKNLPGIRRRLYYKNKAAIATFPKLPDVGAEEVADMAALARLQGDFTLAAEEYWQFIDLKDEASNVTYESVGEDGSKLFNNQANAIVSGQDDEVKGFARQALNDDIVYVYQDRAGKFCVLGNEMFKCHTSPSGDTAAEAARDTDNAADNALTNDVNTNDTVTAPVNDTVKDDGIIDNAGDAVSNVVDGVADGVSNVADGVAEGVDDVADGVSNTTDTVTGNR